MNLDFLQGWLLYPFAEAVHALQGVLCGFLATRAIFKKEISDVLVALLIAGCFAFYEIAEQTKVHDSAYQDFENFWLLAVFTGMIYTAIHLIHLRLKKRSG